MEVVGSGCEIGTRKGKHNGWFVPSVAKLPFEGSFGGDSLYRDCRWGFHEYSKSSGSSNIKDYNIVDLFASTY